MRHLRVLFTFGSWSLHFLCNHKIQLANFRFQTLAQFTNAFQLCKYNAVWMNFIYPSSTFHSFLMYPTFFHMQSSLKIHRDLLLNWYTLQHSSWPFPDFSRAFFCVVSFIFSSFYYCSINNRFIVCLWYFVLK